MRRVCALLLATSLVACASPRPVLYPNAKLDTVGREIADVDIEECHVWAAESGAAGSSAAEATGEVAKQTAENAAGGAAAGAAGGAIRGNAGIGAAVGAASAAAFTAVRGTFRALFRAKDPTPLERRFVERCLRDRGYEVIGWN